MANSVVGCPAVTIPNGTDVSNTVKAREVYGDSDAITLFGPTALDALTFTIEVTRDAEAAVPVWCTLNDGISDVTAPGVSKASIYPAPAFAAFRIKASGNVAAARTWAMQKIYQL